MSKTLYRNKDIGYFDTVDEGLEHFLKAYNILNDNGFLDNKVHILGRDANVYDGNKDHTYSFMIHDKKGVEELLKNLIGNTEISHGFVSGLNDGYYEAGLFLEGRRKGISPIVSTNLNITRYEPKYESFGFLRCLFGAKEKIYVNAYQAIWDNTLTRLDPSKFDFHDIRNLLNDEKILVSSNV